METEKKSKQLGEEIAKWLGIYNILLQNSGGSILEEHLEIINEEMRRLQSQFTKLKDSHSADVHDLYRLQPDNQKRVTDYIAAVKQCLQPIHQPIIGMLNDYFSPVIEASTTNSESYAGILRDLPVVTTPKNALSTGPATQANPSDLTSSSSVVPCVGLHGFPKTIKSVNEVIKIAEEVGQLPCLNAL